MSLQFSDTSNKNGIIQRIEVACGFPDGGISGDTTLIKQFTGSVNETLDRATDIALRSSQMWQFDDTNHSSYPETTFNLVSGTRRYALTSDSNSNLILEIYKVFVMDTAGVFVELAPVDPQTDSYADGFTSGQDQEGLPYEYDKTGKYIDLNPVPNYSQTGGIKVLLTREGSYFVYTDTTKKPGIAGSFHEYFVVRPSYLYARDKSLPNVQGLYNDMLRLEADIASFYSRRDRDEVPVIRPRATDAI